MCDNFIIWVVVILSVESDYATFHTGDCDEIDGKIYEFIALIKHFSKLTTTQYLPVQVLTIVQIQVQP